MSELIVAHRYAKSLLDFAIEKNAVEASFTNPSSSDKLKRNLIKKEFLKRNIKVVYCGNSLVIKNSSRWSQMRQRNNKSVEKGRCQKMVFMTEEKKSLEWRINELETENESLRQRVLVLETRVGENISTLPAYR